MNGFLCFYEFHRDIIVIILSAVCHTYTLLLSSEIPLHTYGLGFSDNLLTNSLSSQILTFRA